MLFIFDYQSKRCVQSKSWTLYMMFIFIVFCTQCLKATKHCKKKYSANIICTQQLPFQAWKLILLIVECSASLNCHSSWPKAKRHKNNHQQDGCFDFFTPMLIAKSIIKEHIVLMRHHRHQDYCFHFLIVIMRSLQIPIGWLLSPSRLDKPFVDCKWRYPCT